MASFQSLEHGLRRHALVLGVSAFAIITCRTPPPLPTSPAGASEPPLATTASAEAAATEEPRPERIEAAAVETAPPRDFAGEQKELAERYTKHRALSTLRGEASYYGKAFAGRKTASGETFEPERYTAAHRSLPFGTVLRVTRVSTRSVVYVRVNDRGPFGKKRRILDLSEAAAGELDMLRDGVCEVRIEVLERGKK